MSLKMLKAGKHVLQGDLSTSLILKDLCVAFMTASLGNVSQLKDSSSSFWICMLLSWLGLQRSQLLLVSLFITAQRACLSYIHL